MIFPRARANVFNSNVYEITNMPRCRVARTTNLSIANAGQTVTFDATAADDTDGMYQAGASTKITARTTGWYLCAGYVLHDTASAAGNGRGAWLLKNGVTTVRYGQDVNAPSTGHGVTNFPNEILLLSPGDYLELFAFQDSGGAQNITTAAGLPAARLHLMLLSSV